MAKVSHISRCHHQSKTVSLLKRERRCRKSIFGRPLENQLKVLAHCGTSSLPIISSCLHQTSMVGGSSHTLIHTHAHKHTDIHEHMHTHTNTFISTHLHIATHSKLNLSHTQKHFVSFWFLSLILTQTRIRLLSRFLAHAQKYTRI